MAQDQNLEQDAFLFTNLVYSLHSSAMMAMGKIANPVTGKEEKEMDAARFNIDLIAMLKKKTEGNLSKNEATLLDTLLTNLRLTFVAEVERDKSKGEQQEAEAGAESEIPEPTSAENHEPALEEEEE